MGSYSSEASMSDMESASSSGYNHGVLSNYGYPTFVYKEEEDCDTGINPVLALSTIGLIGAASLFIFRRITMPPTVRRKKRSGVEMVGLADGVQDLVAAGLYISLVVVVHIPSASIENWMLIHWVKVLQIISKYFFRVEYL